MSAAEQAIAPQAVDERLAQVVKLAIFAVGGQGGGVLNGWIVDLAERNDYDVQATSVAGVAQRTGATIYYVEMMPRADPAPVFSLAPVEGDIDILIAAELMEAGRALTRGFVNPEQTHVIASTHRQLATLEKVVPGDGTAPADTVKSAVEAGAKGVTAFDMQAIAEDCGTVISAALFGALAGSGALPFAADSYRETVKASGRGVAQSLAAFDRALARAEGKAADPEPQSASAPVSLHGPETLRADYAALEARVGVLPPPVVPMAMAGLRAVVDYGDLAYGAEYLDRLERLVATDRVAGGDTHAFDFGATAAKYLARAMAYDDVIRVADLKTRPDRMTRIEVEIGATPAHLMRVTEYTHPGVPEIVSLLPRGIGARVENSPVALAVIRRVFSRGRRIRTDRIGGFLSLYLLAGLRRRRRGLLRHDREMAHIDRWLDLSLSRLAQGYDYGVQTLCARRLIKGYSDTHARGLSKFDRVIAGSALVAGRADAADWTRRLIEAALADVEGDQLDGALQTIRSFAQSPTEDTARSA